MAKTIQVRNVPDSVWRRLKQRADYLGMSLSEHLLVELSRVAALPTRKEWLQRLHASQGVELKESAAVLVRRERDAT